MQFEQRETGTRIGTALGFLGMACIFTTVLFFVVTRVWDVAWHPLQAIATTAAVLLLGETIRRLLA